MCSYIDTPFAQCPLCRDVVFLDQSPEDCVVERGYHACPLRAQFTGAVFVEQGGPDVPVAGELTTIARTVVAAPLPPAEDPVRLKAS